MESTKVQNPQCIERMTPTTHARILAMPRCVAVHSTLRSVAANWHGMLSMVNAGSTIQSLHDVPNGQTASQLCHIFNPECRSTVSVQIRADCVCAWCSCSLVPRPSLSGAQYLRMTFDPELSGEGLVDFVT